MIISRKASNKYMDHCGSNKYPKLVISPINNDIPVSLYKPQSYEKIELRRGHLISSPDGLPHPVD